MRQVTDHVIMIRPRHFGFNAETAENNTFQHQDKTLSPEAVVQEAIREFDAFVEALRIAGVYVDVLDDTDTPVKPDAVFPNNWFTTHQDGTVITYPMMSVARRNERREDLIEALAEKYTIAKRYAFEVYEEMHQFLEGTGSLVLDRVNRIAYACISPRTELSLVEKFCVVCGYTPCTFFAVYDNAPIYHTNVLMSLGTDYVVICLDCIPAEEDRQRILQVFADTGKHVISISAAQMAAFAGNMLQLRNQAGEQICVMSEQAFRSLTPQQVKTLKSYNTALVFCPLPVIETFGGGSARCMIAENFLDPRND